MLSAAVRAVAGEPLLAVRQPRQAIEFGIKPVGDDASLPHMEGSIGFHRAPDFSCSAQNGESCTSSGAMSAAWESRTHFRGNRAERPGTWEEPDRCAGLPVAAGITDDRLDTEDVLELSTTTLRIEGDSSNPAIALWRARICSASQSGGKPFGGAVGRPCWCGCGRWPRGANLGSAGIASCGDFPGCARLAGSMLVDLRPRAAAEAEVGQAGFLRLLQIAQDGRRREDRGIVVGKTKTARGFRLPLTLNLF